MRVLAALLASLGLVSAQSITFAASSTNAAVLAPTCVNGAWQITPSYTFAVTVASTTATSTAAAPSTANGGTVATVVASYFLNKVAAPVTVTNPQDVSTSTTSMNMWAFKINANPVTATVSLAVSPACTAASTAPTVTTAFSSTSKLTIAGGNGIPAITTATAVTLANNLPTANNAAKAAAATTAAATKAAATTKAATTAAATTAAGVPGACFLTVPAAPLTAAGLATPFTVTGNGCIQTLGAGTFVQGTILDLTTGAITNYNPLVIVAGTKPAITPVTPTLPASYIAALWFGTNSMTTTLVAATDPANGLSSLVEGNCVNGGGVPFSIFGQYAACNAAAFMAAADALFAAGLLKIPALGVDNLMGNPCPTTWDFGIVDQDPSDNVDTTYLLVTATGLVAQNTPQNQATLTAAKMNFTIFDNGSDEKLITLIQPLIGCNTFTIQDLADPTGKSFVANYAANELQAKFSQQAPLALITSSDPMVLDGNGNPNLLKLNAFRMNNGQTTVWNLTAASSVSFCKNMFAVGTARLISWFPNLLNAPPPDFAAALSNTLAGVLTIRFNQAVGAGNLNCAALMAAAGMAPATTTVATASNSFHLQDTTTAAPTGAVLVSDTPLVWSTMQNLVADDGTIALSTMFNADGTLPAGMAWETAVGVPNQVAILDATNTPTTTTAVATTDTTTTSSFSAMWLGIGIGGGVALMLVIGLVYYFHQKSMASSFKQSQTGRMTAV